LYLCECFFFPLLFTSPLFLLPHISNPFNQLLVTLHMYICPSHVLFFVLVLYADRHHRTLSSPVPFSRLPEAAVRETIIIVI
jgi:hypothetical protein